MNDKQPEELVDKLAEIDQRIASGVSFLFRTMVLATVIILISLQ